MVNFRSHFESLWHIALIIALVIFALVMLTMIGALLRSATKWGQRASHKEHHLFEGLYTAVGCGVAAWLIMLSLDYNRYPKPVPPKLVVHVLGYQWCWRFSYGGTPVSVTNDCLTPKDFPTLVVPVDEPIQFDVTSNDVIHAFWVPHWRYKIWAYPAHLNSFETTLHHTGTYIGRCAEFCGLFHYDMHFHVKQVTPAAFTAWLHAQEAKV